MKEFIEKLIDKIENEAFAVQLEKGIKHPSTLDAMLEKFSVFRIKEIVNQLAEEYNNDFCEWKEDKNFNWFFKSPHEGVGIVKEESSLFNFCPYCGKKIKVAPYQSKGE